MRISMTISRRAAAVTRLSVLLGLVFGLCVPTGHALAQTQTAA